MSTGFFPARQVPPYALWIGSMMDSRAADAMARHDVGLVVNCTRDLPFEVGGVRRVRVPVHDSPDENAEFARALPKAVAAIQRALASRKGVLVHCFAGISRSASVVAAFLMAAEGLSARQAMARIQAVKPETFGEPNFLPALDAWGRYLRRQR